MIGRNLKTLFLMLKNTRYFYPEKVFKKKRVAVIGAADTALETENGDFIDSFDVVVRINKALITWNPDKQVYIGKKTDILFHSFFENEQSGGGPVNPKLFQEFGLKLLVHPNYSWKGLRTHFNFYKRHGKPYSTYLLSRKVYNRMKRNFGKVVPTVGFSALYCILTSPCEEIFITGFSFFKTPYAEGYRDHLLNTSINDKHIEAQGLHDPDLEYKLFNKLLEMSPCRNIYLDNGLNTITGSKFQS